MNWVFRSAQLLFIIIYVKCNIFSSNNQYFTCIYIIIIIHFLIFLFMHFNQSSI